MTALDSLQKEISTVVENVRLQGKTGKTGDQKTEILLVIDQPDFLLAATGPGQGIGATEMQDWLMGLEQVRKILKLDPDEGKGRSLINFPGNTGCPLNHPNIVSGFPAAS